MIHAWISFTLFFGIVWRVYDALPDGTNIRMTLRQSIEMCVLTYKTRKVLHG